MKTTFKTCIARKLAIGAIVVAGFMPTASQADMLVTSWYPGRVLRYDENTGTLLGPTYLTNNSTGVPLQQADGMVFGRDGNIYVTVSQSNQIVRLNGQTWAFIDVFATNGLGVPAAIRTGPDGNFYVCNNSSNNIAVLDGQTGALLRSFGQTNLQNANDLVFGPDGMLYVADRSKGVVKFNPASGSFISVFCDPAIFTNGFAYGVAFGPDGNLYVSQSASVNAGNVSCVLRFNGTNGVFIQKFASGGGLWNPVGLTFGPDGNLYVVSNDYGDDSHSYVQGVLRYNGTNGQFINVFASGGLNVNWGVQKVIFTPRINLDLHIYAGITLNGTTGITYEIQYATSVASTNWQHLADVLLLNSPYIYFDTNSIGAPMRFYRALIK